MTSTNTPARRRPRRIAWATLTAAGLIGSVAVAAGGASAHAPSGAIFTTLPDGSQVNFNIYDDKSDVYLDGGPGSGAPQDAAGLDDGTYVFQVTDPSGKTLLSSDAARCRQFTVAGGVITGVVAQLDGCEHVTGFDVDHSAVTVQLMPYDDTPNPGGEYKAWAVRVEDFLAGCAAFGVADGLAEVDCGQKGGNRHGFVPSHSKTDNFKVGEQVPVEIDTRFWRDGELIDGLKVTWTDTLGASNTKWSEWLPQNMVFHEAHVEAVERGTHKISIENQPGCEIHDVHLAGKLLPNSGPQTVSVKITSTRNELTVFIDVDCH
jgi:hypothetical protein